MDRLVIGDVGYGKTEVALRAAAIAALAGHQVAIAAPTTVLARQHLESFTERFEGTGLVVAGLSRLSSAAEKKRVARVAFDVPVFDFQVGDGQGQVPLRRLQRKMMKLPRDLKGTQVADLNFRLKALPQSLQAPKGPMPTRGRQPRMPRPRAR